MKRYIGQHVTIFFDPRDLSQIHLWVREADTYAYICTAVDQGRKATQIGAGTVRARNAPAKQQIQRRVRSYQQKGEAALKSLEQLESIHPENQNTPDTTSPTNPMSETATQTEKLVEGPGTQPAREEPTPGSAKQQSSQLAEESKDDEKEDNEDWDSKRRQLYRSRMRR